MSVIIASGFLLHKFRKRSFAYSCGTQSGWFRDLGAKIDAVRIPHI